MKTRFIPLFIAFLALPALSQAAAVDYFLKIDGIPGESQDSSHANEIDILSWSWGVGRDVSSGGAGGGAGKVSFQDLNLTKRIDKSTPKLMEACVRGNRLPAIQLFSRRTDDRGEQHEYLVVTFSDVLVSSYQTGGSAGDVVPMDQVSFNFTEIRFEYTPQRSDGSPDEPVEFSYDIKEQTAARE